MKVHQELTITISDSPEKTFQRFVDSALWQREIENEKQLIETFDISQIGFKYKGKKALSSRLWMINENDKWFKVTNIIPLSKSELTIDEYNYVLNNFVDEVIKGLKYELTQADLSLNDLISFEASQKFQAFSKTANKSIGHAHPNDEQRWFAFIYSTVVEDKYLPPDYLEHFLIQDNWNQETAFELSLDYEYAFHAMKYAMEGNHA